MDFVHPLFLWGLPLSVLPLVIHLWGRRRRTPTPFSNVDVLKESLPDRFSPVQLRRWLLLVIRTMSVLLIVLTLARPVVRGVMGLSGRRVVVLLDASYSMATAQFGQSVFDQAQTLARSLMESRQGKDGWGLVVFSDRVEIAVPVNGDVRPVLSALQSAKPTYRGTRFAPGLEQARALLGKSGTVVLLSDMAAHGGPVRFTDEKGDYFVVAVQVGDLSANGAVTGLRPSGPGILPCAETRRWGDPSARTWVLSEEGRVSARGVVSWNGATGVAALPSVNRPVEFQLESDALPADNRYYFVPPQAQARSVMVVNGAPSLSPVGDETHYVRPVLNRLRTLGWSVRTLSVDEMATALREKERQAAFSVVLLFNPPPLSPEIVGRLAEYVQNGGGLWVTAGDRGGWDALQNLLPLSALGVAEEDQSLRYVDGGPLPALNGFSWKTTTVDRAVTGSPRAGAWTVLETVASRQPLLSVREDGTGRVGFWGATIDRDWTSFPARPAYPILVNEMVQWLSEKKGSRQSHTLFVGDDLDLPGAGEKPPLLLRPDGKTGPFFRVGDRWRYAETDVPGFYQVLGNPAIRFAVNVRSDTEGNPARYSQEEFARSLGAVPGRLLTGDQAQLSEIAGVLRGKDRTPLLIKIILFLAALETVLLAWPRGAKT